MNKIIREHVPVTDLPESLRLGLDPNAKVTVTVEVESLGDVPVLDDLPDRVMTLDEIFSYRRPPYRSAEDIVAEARRIRDGWDD